MLKRFGILGLVLAGMTFFQPKASAQDYRYDRDGYVHRGYNDRDRDRHEDREWREHERREWREHEWRERERWERPYYGYNRPTYYVPAPGYYAPNAGVYFSWRSR